MRRNGFATVMALVALFMVGVTTAGLMTCAHLQARRTEMELDRVQREQIEIARSLGNGVVVPTELK